MKGMQIFALLLATVFIVIGSLMSARFEQGFGHTLFLSGAIIFSGVLISSAILAKDG
jgi:hypothetical protein